MSSFREFGPLNFIVYHRDSKQRAKVVADVFPQFKFGNNTLQYAKEFKYLGHIITEDLTDDADIQREIRNLSTRTSILLRRFQMLSSCQVHFISGILYVCMMQPCGVDIMQVHYAG